MPYINKPHKHYTIPYKKDDVDGAKYYNSKYWKRLRNQFIMMHPLCHDCALKGISRPADEVHHVIPWGTGKTEEEKWNLLLDPNNLVSLCIKCHHERHRKINQPL